MNAPEKNLQQTNVVSNPLLFGISPRELTFIPEGDGEGMMRLTIIRRDGKTHRGIQHLYGEEAQVAWAAICKACHTATNAKRRRSE